MASVDLDGNSNLDFEEFLTATVGWGLGGARRARVRATTPPASRHSPQLKPYAHPPAPCQVFLGKLERRELFMTAFQHIDVDGSGFITEEELREVRGGGRRKR